MKKQLRQDETRISSHTSYSGLIGCEVREEHKKYIYYILTYTIEYLHRS
jgi:hypothetical protein